jgi:CheY-like chemotaxis protein
MIDDDESICVMAKSILGDDYDVTTVNSGKQALKLFFHGLVSNLVLLDLTMPEKGGWGTPLSGYGTSAIYTKPR